MTKIDAISLQFVCNTPNVDVGQKVVVALVGAVMPSSLVIKEAPLRGVDLNGMIGSAKELAYQLFLKKKGYWCLMTLIRV